MDIAIIYLMVAIPITSCILMASNYLPVHRSPRHKKLVGKGEQKQLAATVPVAKPLNWNSLEDMLRNGAAVRPTLKSFARLKAAYLLIDPNQSLGIEDRHSYDSAREEFIPELVGYFKKANFGATGKVITQADQLFIEQMDILSAMLMEIADRQKEDALSVLHQNQKFLTSRSHPTTDETNPLPSTVKNVFY